MITVCQTHIKDGLITLTVPHVKKLAQKYWKHECKFCSKTALYKLF